MIRDLPTDRIDIRPDARPVDLSTVAGLVESIGNVGLINPIRVRGVADRWEVIAGVHRLTAVRQIGTATISAHVVTDDDLHAELAMIDENLCRAELTPSDRAKQTARRKAIYLELHPETAAHVSGGKARQETASDKLSFADATADATGRDKRTVQRDAERGEKVIDEVLALIHGTKLDTGSYLDKIKGLSPNEQVTAANRDLAKLKADERDKAKAKSRPNPANRIEVDVKAKAAAEVASIIAEHVPAEWIDAAKANLYAAGAKNIADALANLTAKTREAA